jgi:hypothetical protein
VTRSIILILGTLLWLTAARATGDDRVLHIRTAEPSLASAVTTGVHWSPLFRDLIRRLDVSDVVVYLEYAKTLDDGIAGQLSFVSSAADLRYVKIVIDRRLLGGDRVSMLGHELQHATEVADATWVVDQATMATLHSRVGIERMSCGHRVFDSRAAIDAGNRIRREIGSAGSISHGSHLSPDGR